MDLNVYSQDLMKIRDDANTETLEKIKAYMTEKFPLGISVTAQDSREEFSGKVVDYELTGGLGHLQPGVIIERTTRMSVGIQFIVAAAREAK